ncbi:hypothetical protein [Pedobacter foliorum]|uniref:hypothetical protein n=1 Tax=Pedobacter foliorum TaxID=2739058 RepID=UPI001565425A|nr:hypothetical protein [Pedobacter foliorum]NRF40530.1 hypothetical protein [Pedobacter foliorum]
MEDSIKGLVPHVLSFVINELCKNGFMIAYEKDLSDLKGLIEPDSISPDDLELLEAVDDEVVRILLSSIDKVVKCSQTYFLINNLDEMEVMENEEYSLLASDNYYAYIIDWESKSYKDLLYNLNAVYFSISQLLYHTTCQIKLDEVEIPDEMYDEFIDKYSELLRGNFDPDDKNISLLYSLIIELNNDLSDIDNLAE